MAETTLQDIARYAVLDYYNERVEKTDKAWIKIENTYVVWFTYILGNWKALVSTTVSDGMYYEVTHNAAKEETYLDAYKKWDNITLGAES